MLLTLIKKRKTRYGWKAKLIETNHLTGNRLLALVHIRFEDWPLPLIYPLNITRSGLHIRRQQLRWKWQTEDIRRTTEDYLCGIQKSREEIFLDVV